MLKYIALAIICGPLFSDAQTEMNKKTEIHGHRGFRGHFPENTLTAFKEAAKLGVDAIEMDIIISKDSQVVVSHEPWFNYKICSEPDGEQVRSRKQHNLHTLTYAQIRQYDCGKRGNPGFPEQAKIPEYKPLLSEVIEGVEQYCKDNHLPLIQYNIEIKSGKLGDGKYHPAPAEIARLLNNVLKKYGIGGRILIQSFDVRSLQAMHQLDPSLRIGLLVANFGSVAHNIHRLGFTPYMYNPALKLVSAKTVQQVHEKGAKIIVWTVNSPADMKRLILLGVDGLITDYPNIALALK
ncbi:MAG: hypothetical protein JWP12_3008 [Bacteroidetes bacterium]|nr:hypothetical protein [Bacteroidota bacterium]